MNTSAVAVGATAPPDAAATSAAAASAVSRLSPDSLPLALRGVCKRWAKDQEPVLRDVDLDLDLGTRTWIGGINGVGKTTLLRIAAGLIEPEAGRATAWGFSAGERRAQYQRLISFLPAGDRGLYARLTVRRQIEFWGRIALVPRSELAPAVERVLDTFDLRGLEGRRVDRLSMGQRQRVRIAMTFLAGPEVVLLDEPLTSLDTAGGELLERAIDELVDKGGAVLWCSPAGDRLEHEFDARYHLEGGRLVAA